MKLDWINWVFMNLINNTLTLVFTKSLNNIILKHAWSRRSHLITVFINRCLDEGSNLRWSHWVVFIIWDSNDIVKRREQWRWRGLRFYNLLWLHVPESELTINGNKYVIILFLEYLFVLIYDLSLDKLIIIN